MRLENFYFYSLPGPNANSHRHGLVLSQIATNAKSICQNLCRCSYQPLVSAYVSGSTRWKGAKVSANFRDPAAASPTPSLSHPPPSHLPSSAATAPPPSSVPPTATTPQKPDLVGGGQPKSRRWARHSIDLACIKVCGSVRRACAEEDPWSSPPPSQHKPRCLVSSMPHMLRSPPPSLLFSSNSDPTSAAPASSPDQSSASWSSARRWVQ